MELLFELKIVVFRGKRDWVVLQLCVCRPLLLFLDTSTQTAVSSRV